MRQAIKQFVSLVATSLPIIDPIYEFGALQVPGQEDFSDLRPLFPNRRYVGCDMRKGPGVDKLMNLHEIDLPSEHAGTILCLDTLEHVEYPRQAMKEIHRILKSEGIVIISSVMNFPIHDYPYDYWRFTPEAFRSLLKEFSHSFIGFSGDESFPHTVIGIGFKNDCPPLSAFEAQFEIWKKAKDGVTIRSIAKLVIPPILLPTFTYFRHVLSGREKQLE